MGFSNLMNLPLPQTARQFRCRETDKYHEERRPLQSKGKGS
jgi:hypothetical protein